MNKSTHLERVAIVDGAVLHERVGDPDMSDSLRHYVVRITDAGLVDRVRRYIKKVNSTAARPSV